ncbi:MAG TPA: GatB/YqeY domain-containing protein [Candidatus Saccharimonadales bacterium]|nr:GatB/YqeY domain-containing protein [Candidatus Saccharimonadales bacterium]
MMNLGERVERDLTAAMKAGQADRVAVLRLLKNSLKNERIKLGHELGESEEIRVLQREAKQRRDSIEAYGKAGRSDLATAETNELTIASEYLPAQISEAELTAMIDQVIAETGASGMTEMGRVIGQVLAQAGGQAEGATVSRLVKQRLQERGEQ